MGELISRRDALIEARTFGKDVILIEGEIQIFKIVDYLQLLKEIVEKEKDKELEKKTELKVKEILMRPKIEKNDYETKLNNLKRFLERGHRVKILSCGEPEETLKQLTTLQDKLTEEDNKIVVAAPMRTEKDKTIIEFIKKK